MTGAKLPPEETPEESPRGRAWRPRLADALRGRSRAEETGFEAAPVAPAAPVVDDDDYKPFVPSVPLPRREHSAMLAPDGMGDAMLAPDDSATHLGGAPSARLSDRAIALAGMAVVAGVLLSRLLGWARGATFGAEFGASHDMDAFWAAFRIPDTLFQLVAAGAIGSAVVPVASELIARGDDEGARRLVSTLTNLMIVVLAPLAAVTWLAAPVLVPLMVPSWQPPQIETTIFLTRLMLLSPILLAIGAVMAAALNARGIFGPPAMAPNVYNLVIIAAAIALTPFLGITSLAVGVILGALGHVLTQTRAFMDNQFYRPILDLKDPAVRETLRLMGPRALGLGATQLVFLVATMFASDTPKNLSYFNYTFITLQIPVGLIGVPLGIVLLPPLSRAFALGDRDRFRSLADQSLRLLLFVTAFLTGLMLALATPTIALLWQHGKITVDDVQAMVPIYVVFLAGLVAHSMISLLAPIFYAGKDTRTPVTAALVAVAVDVGAAVVLFPFFHLLGLAFAIGLGAWAEVIVLVVLMEKRIGFDLRPLVRHSAAFAGGACVAAAAAYVTAHFSEGDAGGPVSVLTRIEELTAAGFVALAVYALWSFLFRLPELRMCLDMARSILRRRGHAQGKDQV